MQTYKLNLLQEDIISYQILHQNGRAYYQQININKNLNCYNLYKSLLNCFPILKSIIIDNNHYEINDIIDDNKISIINNDDINHNNL